MGHNIEGLQIIKTLYELKIRTSLICARWLK